MCGIVGFTNFNQKFDKQSINSMVNKIVNRGPDFNSFMHKENISLGHSRLSIIDLTPSANQPMIDISEKYVIVFNGEIYNFLELKRQLKLLKKKFKTNSDTEVILEGFKAWGTNLFQKLDGMFAFCIWDILNETGYLVRDKFGEKPLFYYILNNEIVFASDLRSIKEGPQFNNKLKTSSIYSYLNFNYVKDNEKTIYSNVKKLKSGSYIKFSKNKKEYCKYFSFKNLTLKNNYKNLSPNEINITLDKMIHESVISRSISDTEVGLFLSGGLDSTLISYYASKNNSNLKAFSLGFEQKSFDEVEKSKLISKKLDLDHYIEYFDQKNFSSIDFEKIIEKIGEPLADTAILSNFILSKFTKQYVKVCLSGDGADEIFSGYDTMDATYLYENIFSKFNKNINILLNSLVNMLPDSNKKINNIFKIKKFFDVIVNDPDFKHSYWRKVFNNNHLNTLLTNEFKSFLDKDNFKNSFHSKFEDLDYINKLTMIDLNDFLIEDILVKVDRSSMANGLEVRCPFLNEKILEFVFSLNLKQRYSLFNKKKLIKNLLTNKFPKSITNQKKRGFNFPIANMFKLGTFDEILIENLKKQSIFDTENVIKMLKIHKIGNNDYHNELFNILTLITWTKLNGTTNFE
jgi:asparagine synthase (glutamine-hydrolysing)